MRRFPLALVLLAGCSCGEPPPLGGIDAPPGDTPRGDTPPPDGRIVVVPSDAGPLALGPHPRILVADGAPARARLVSRLESDAGRRWTNMVDRGVSGDVYAFRASDAALLGLLTNDASYCAHAVSAVDERVAAEEAAIAAGERPTIANDSYLEVGDAVADLSLVYDWCFPQVTPDMARRWIDYANQAVWNVWNHEEATWGGRAYPWTGWSVDNPVNNFHSSFLEATMMLALATLEENALAEAWLAQFRTTKLELQLAPTFERDLAGGGSREGTGYGTAMFRLFWLYDVWEETTGERIAEMTSHTRSSLPYLLHATTPTLDRLAPFGDHSRDSSAALFDYHRRYLLELVDLFPDDPVTPMAVEYLADCSVPAMAQQSELLWDVLYAPEPSSAPLSGLGTVYFAEGAGHVFVRSAWDADASYLAFVAGPYTESHAHQDQGSFVLFHREWLAHDENVETHSGIQQGTEVHNLVRLERGDEVIPMRADTEVHLSALEVHGSVVYLAADTAPAYRDDTIARVLRRLVFVRPGLVVIDDLVQTSDPGVRAVWSMQSPIAPTVSATHARLEGTRSRLDVHVVEGASSLSTLDWHTVEPDEFLGGHRLDAAAPAGADAHFLTVLSVDGTARAVARTGSSVTIDTAEGPVQVAFPTDGGPALVTLGATTIAFDGVVEPQPLLVP